MSEGLAAEAAAVVDVASSVVEGAETVSENSLDPFSEINAEEGLELEGEEDLDLEGEEAPTEKEIVKEIKRLKKLTLKYNGKEYEEELPFEIDDNPEAIEYMTRQLQMAKMGQHKSQELSDIQTDIREFVEQLKTDPRKILSDPSIGLDLKQLAAEILEEEIENSQKSPEQLEHEALQRELQELKDTRNKEQEDFRSKEMERLQSQEYERYDTLMSQALDGSDLPKTPYVVKKMADYMIMAINNGHDVEPKDILPIVRDEILEDVRSMFSVMDAEQLNKIIGNDSYDKVRKHRLSKARGKKKSPATSKKAQDVGKVTQSTKKAETSKINFKEFFGV